MFTSSRSDTPSDGLVAVENADAARGRRSSSGAADSRRARARSAGPSFRPQTMCLWRLSLLGRKKRPGPVARRVRPRGSRRTATSDRGDRDDRDDDVSDSGVSSGEFSLENVCDDVAAARPARPPADERRYVCGGARLVFFFVL